MRAYLDFLSHIYTNGSDRDDRTGTGTRSVFGYQLRFDLAQGFPLLTTKKVHLKSIIYELLWFLRGDTNINYLKQHGVSIWDEWATAEGELGPVYGKQWRSWQTDSGSIDQIAEVMQLIATEPNSRRLLVSAWNPAVLPDSKLSPQQNAANGRQALPPCHTMFQFYVDKGALSCQLYQRSADAFLGVPFNIASYALLTLMISHCTGLAAGEFIHTFGDAHIYHNHFSQVQTQLEREPLPLPSMELNPQVRDIFGFAYNDFELKNYQSHAPIKAPIAI